MTKDDLLEKLRLAVLEQLATDDKTGGEGLWTFRVEPNGTDRVALPPAGTWEATVKALCAAIVGKVGGGHVEDVWVEPADHAQGKRPAIVVGGPAAGFHPGPAGPAGPGSPDPPPAKPDEVD